MSVVALLLVNAVPVECNASGEAGQKILRVDSASGAEDEELGLCQLKAPAEAEKYTYSNGCGEQE